MTIKARLAATAMIAATAASTVAIGLAAPATADQRGDRDKTRTVEVKQSAPQQQLVYKCDCGPFDRLWRALDPDRVYLQQAK